MIKGFIMPVVKFFKDHPFWGTLSALYILYFFVFLLVEIFYTERLSFGICLTEECLQSVKSTIPNFIELNKWVVTTTAIVFAAISLRLSYKSFEVSRKNSIFNNHIANKRFFSEHVLMELERCNYLNQDSVNINTFYSFVFPESSNGSCLPSDKYGELLLNVRGYLITTSKRQKTKRDFDYRAHQKSIANKLKPLGFEFNSLPKADFYLVEKDVFKLIDSLTKLITSYDRKYFLEEVDIHYR